MDVHDQIDFSTMTSEEVAKNLLAVQALLRDFDPQAEDLSATTVQQPMLGQALHQFSPTRPIPHQFQHSLSLQQYATSPIAYSSGPAPLAPYIQAPSHALPHVWQQQAISYYRAPSVSSVDFRYSPYGGGLLSSSPSSGTISSSGSNTTNNSTNRKRKHPRECLEYWKIPERTLELSIIRLCFLNTHVFIMAGPQVLLTTSKTIEFIQKAIALFRKGEEKLDFDPLQHIINLIKGRVGTRRRNDLDTLRVYIVSSAIYQDPQDALHASFSQHNKHNTYIHILNSEGGITAPFQNPMFLSVVSFVYGRIKTDQRACGVTDEDVMENTEVENKLIPLFVYPYSAFLITTVVLQSQLLRTHNSVLLQQLYSTAELYKNDSGFKSIRAQGM